MNTVVYADILIVVNILVNYFLFRASAAVTKLEFKPVRLLAASVLGGVFSLIIFIDGLHWVLSAVIKTAFIIISVFVAFKPVSLKVFLKCTAAFLLSNFVFAGIMLACCTVFFPNLVIYKNGVVYFDIDILTLAVASVVCYAVLTLISYFTASRVPPKSIFDFTLFYGDKILSAKALFDTGNGLKDSFSGRPVIIAEADFLEEAFGKGFDCTKMKNYRLVPYSTIKGNGVLPAFLADKVTVTSGDKTVTAFDIYIAVTDKKIISGGYSALLSTTFFEYTENSRKGEKIN